MRGPADLQEDKRQAIWTCLRAAKGPISQAEIARTCGAHRKTVADHVGGWIASGHVERDEEGWFRLVKDTGHEAPRRLPDGSEVARGLGQEQMWWTMQRLAEFTVTDLRAHASVPITEATAKSYVGMLLATGYLRVTRPAVRHLGRLAAYRLIRNSGPRPPMIQHTRVVWDPNTRKTHLREGRR